MKVFAEVFNMAKKEKNEVTVVLKSDGSTRRRIFATGVTFGLGIAALAVYALAKWDEIENSCKCGGHCHCKDEKVENSVDDLDDAENFEDFDDEDYFEDFEEDDIWDDTEAFGESIGE